MWVTAASDPKTLAWSTGRRLRSRGGEAVLMTDEPHFRSGYATKIGEYQ